MHRATVQITLTLLAAIMVPRCLAAEASVRVGLTVKLAPSAAEGLDVEKGSSNSHPPHPVIPAEAILPPGKVRFLSERANPRDHTDDQRAAVAVFEPAL